MSLLAYVLVLAVWVGALEYLFHCWRRGEYRQIAAMRTQAAALLREATLARLRPFGGLRAGSSTGSGRARANISALTRRAS